MRLRSPCRKHGSGGQRTGGRALCECLVVPVRRKSAAGRRRQEAGAGAGKQCVAVLWNLLHGECGDFRSGLFAHGVGPTWVIALVNRYAPTQIGEYKCLLAVATVGGGVARNCGFSDAV